MRRAWGGLLVVVALGLAAVGEAQVLTLNAPETLAVPTATKLDLRKIEIDVTSKSLVCTYRFVTAENLPIPMAASSAVDRTWRCQDIPAQLAANCTAVGEPYPGCTGVGTGSNLDPGSTCFTDTFGFTIRAQDVGVQIGKGLRALIWARMRPAVLTGANNATLP